MQFRTESASPDYFPPDSAGLPARRRSEISDLSDGAIVSLKATMPWRALRLENRYDGAHETQTPSPAGERLRSRVVFPDRSGVWCSSASDR